MSVRTGSIDLWGTLIKGSPSFSPEKIKLTKEYFASEGDLSDDFIKMAYDATKKQLNNIIEVTGWQPEQDHIFRLMAHKLSSPHHLRLPSLSKFIYDYQELAIQHNPIPYSEETEMYLEKLSADNHLYLSSNTMFIDGKSLRRILAKLGWSKYFEGMLFSSEQKVSKPNRIMYKNSNFHIGDNFVTDGLGAIAAGSTPCIINSNEHTIKDAYNFITQR